ncbi:MAG: division/cell wall cluster transcriptional repressor MraZ [Oscillospiraceae bacterium]|nr:division/cell wall cluster transcriptional repressor MraZ [Candidatus Ruminococcus equi]
MFSGTSIHSIDSKGRIVLPQDFREQLGESFYVTSGFNKCVQILSVEEFDRLREQIRLLPADKALSLQYVLISPATLVSPNSQGRVTISQKLREDSSLKKDVVVVGMDTRIEVWDKEEFDMFIEKQKQDSLKEALELLRL